MTDAPAIAFVTLGCPKNEVDTDRMAASVQASAYRLTDTLEDADVVVLNTCAFIQAATEESIAAAFELTGSWREERPGRRVIVAGCMVSRYGADLAGAMPEPDSFVPVADEDGIVPVIEGLTGAPARTHPIAVLRTPPGMTGYLKVSEGCDRRCAYCTIPAIRGPFVSAPMQPLIDEARFLAEGGAREIILVGQDIARYGHGLPADTDLPQLVERLSAIDGDFRIRLMYVQPDGVTPRLLETMAASPRVCRYLDIPLQHASERVLKAMGRPGGPEAHIALLERIRAVMPEVSLRTTVMAGFPGETEDDFDELARFLAEARFDHAGVFAYSPEEGTRAAVMPDQVPEELRLERAQILRDIADETGFARAAARVGSVQQLLIEGTDEDGSLWGRTCGQAPEVDGITFFDSAATPGTLVVARIADSIGYDLVGVPL